jgi:DNA-binding MarR family transcriptional regulator
MSPRPVFDPVIHEPNRLRICSLLVPHTSVEFAVLRDELDLSDSALSKHLKTLENSGHVRLLKQATGGHVRTSAALTDAGREALCCHVAEIQRMARLVSTRPVRASVRRR